MTAADIFRPSSAATAGRGFVAAFVATVGLSAFLLFSVQPIFAKMMLPTLGGAPAVWSVAMVFFQALLLAGYAYAHLLTRLMLVSRAALVHLAVLVLAFAALPIAMAEGWGRPPADGEAVWLIGVFFASVGLPFFAVSANGPLLQAWYAASGRPGAENPYFLYAASNLGSFGALIAYPLVIEPFATLHEQSLLWTGGFIALACLIGACGALSRGGAAPSPASQADAGAPRAWIAWIGFAFVPSGLLVAVTAHISTDVAAMPLLWVAPLALYLLTFVLAFRTKPAVRPEVLACAQIVFTALALVGLAMRWPMWLALPLDLALLFTVAMSAHVAIYTRRPAASDLTRFYLFMSLGGVLGGAFAALAAPRLFANVAEYPILILLGLFCIPTLGFARDRLKGAVGAACAAVLIAAVGVGAVATGMLPGAAAAVLFPLALGGLAAAHWRRPEQAVPPLFAAAALACGIVFPGEGAETVRSFFGVHKLSETGDGRFLTLMHGTTVHGATRLRNEDGSAYLGPPEPIAYYTREGALGSAISSIREARGGSLPRWAAIGLGAGGLACHRGPAENLTYFEIDEAVIRIARDSGRFRFLSSCAPDARIVLGDARLTIADEKDRFSLIVVDAFSSDAIPAHLITREALALYLSKLDDRGAILLHVTNRHLDLAQILARAGAELGLKAYLKRETAVEPLERRFRAPSTAVVLARDARDVGALAMEWEEVRPDMARRAWSDDFSNILEAIRDKRAL